MVAERIGYSDVEHLCEIARSYGQTVVVNGEWRGRWSADGEEGKDRLRFTTVYTKRDGKWHAVAEMTSLPAQ